MTIRTKTTLVTAALAATVAAGAPAGTAATTGLGPCGSPVSAAGGKWIILSAPGVSCGSAAGIVKRLAGRTIPSSRIFGGTYLGMRCFGGPTPGKLPASIICGNKASQKFFSAYKNL